MTASGETLRYQEHFAGGGMAGAGLGVGWTRVFANDNDVRKCAAYAANWGRQGLVVGDIADLKPSDLSTADLSWASFPCQDVSLAGDRAGLGGSRSSAFWAFWQLMQGLRAEGRAPKLIAIENVTGLLTSHGGMDFDAINSALEDADFRTGAVVIDAALFVPQSRPRLFIVAVDTALRIPAALVASGPTAPFHPPMLIAACLRQRNPIWWRLPTPPTRNTTLIDLLEDPPRGVNWHTEAETNRLLEMMSPVNVAKVEAAKRSRRRIAGTAFRRMRDGDGGRIQRTEARFDEIAGCLRIPTGGSSRQFVIIVAPLPSGDGAAVRSRLLSPRESARLMGLGEDYQLPANTNEALFLTGDGVVVPVVRFLAEHLFEPILRAPTRTTAGLLETAP